MRQRQNCMYNMAVTVQAGGGGVASLSNGTVRTLWVKGLGAALALSLIVAGYSDVAGARSPSAAHAVGVITETFVDHSRSTPANGSYPALPERTLVTTIWYPAQGNADGAKPLASARPDHSGGPYPLIVFAHGLGANPQYYEAILSRWAAAGYVVAAPQFPLTSTNAPGGLNPEDVFSQPSDMSYVITSVLKMSSQHTGTLAAMVSPHQVGVAGHSEGAITTLGFFNSCCRDSRVKAAEVLDGDPESYPNGRYEFGAGPPLLVVHGTDDALLPYDQMVGVFNRAKGPKGLLSLEGAGHANWLTPSAKWFKSAVQTTVEFFDAYLRGDKAAIARLTSDGQRGVSTVHFDAKRGSTMTIPTPPQPRTDLHASVTPSTNLTSGQSVTIHWSGYLPGKTVNVVECSSDSATGCDIAGGRILTPDPTGTGTISLTIVEGKVGTGTCDTTHDGCQIAVNDAGLEAPSATVRIPITFAPS
jgi:dienelactone hydrolase